MVPRKLKFHLSSLFDNKADLNFFLSNLNFMWNVDVRSVTTVSNNNNSYDPIKKYMLDSKSQMKCIFMRLNQRLV